MWDGQIARWEGGILFGILVGFIVFLVRGAVSSRKATRKAKENEQTEDAAPEKQLGIPLYLLIVLGALVGMYFGSDYLLIGAVGIAEEAGMPQHVIGVTIVAVGTSVPELVTSVMASLRKQTDISVGNLLGSNIFNIGAVLGIAAIVKPIPVAQEALDFDMWYVAGLSLALLPILAIRRKIDRLRGILLFLSYAAYLVVLVLKVTGKM
jgi:cation:H+ antiporter